MSTPTVTTLTDLLVEMMRDPAFAAEYERTRPLYDEYLRAVRAGDADAVVMALDAIEQAEDTAV